ncbi:MAG: hypothetical protein ABEL76_00840 [Bradymonadaceae bacterium]
METRPDATTSATGTEAASGARCCELFVDPNYTVGELDWSRLLGSGGIGRRLLGEMERLSSTAFDFGGGRRVPVGGGERFEFEIEGRSHSIEFNYDAPMTHSLRWALRRFFGAVNAALHRSGLEWRYLLTRELGHGGRFEYHVRLLPRSVAVEQSGEEFEVVAGVDMRDIELSV